MASKPTSSAAAKRVQASKARQRSRVETPTPIGDALGNIISSKSQATLNKNLNKAAQPSPTDVPWKQKFNDINTPPGIPRSTTFATDNPQMGTAPQGDDGGLGAMQAALAAQMAGGGGGVSDKEIAKLLSQSVNGTYNPQIKAIQQEMGRAKGRAKSARADLKALYADLSGYYENHVGSTRAMYGVAKKGAEQRTAGVKNAITQDYTNRLKEQVDMYKQLGIEAAAPSATEGQYSDEASQLATADNTGNAEAQALGVEERGNETYWSEGAGIAQMEGAEQQSNVIQQLNDYLNTQGSSLAGLQGQKSAAYSQALLEAKQKRADDANKKQNQIWQHMLDLAKLKQSAAKTSNKTSPTPTKGLTGVYSYLGSERLTNEFQTSLGEATTWSNTPQGKQYYGGHSPNTPEEMAQVIRDNAANRGLSADDQLKLWQAALVYYNKLK